MAKDHRLKPSKILFLIDDAGVHLCYGPFQVCVCDSPEEFGEFEDEMQQQLRAIGEEIDGNYKGEIDGH